MGVACKEHGIRCRRRVHGDARKAQDTPVVAKRRGRPCRTCLEHHRGERATVQRATQRRRLENGLLKPADGQNVTRRHGVHQLQPTAHHQKQVADVHLLIPALLRRAVFRKVVRPGRSSQLSAPKQPFGVHTQGPVHRPAVPSHANIDDHRTWDRTHRTARRAAAQGARLR
jgi:hypothetical protein